MSSILLWLSVCVCVCQDCWAMKTVPNVTKKRGYYVYLATEDRTIHMARSNYARIVPALSAHHFTGQQFSLTNSHSTHSSFRSLHIHYHSWIIRSEALWRRSSWQSNCYSAGSRSWERFCCIMTLNPEEINKDSGFYSIDPIITGPCKKKKKNTSQRQSHLHLSCVP